MRRTVKIAAACLAFLPLAVLGLNAADMIAFGIAVKCAMVINIPVFLLVQVLETFQMNPVLKGMIYVVLLLGWASVLAVMFWKIASASLGENEPNGKFDWIAFETKFFVGAILGGLLGWRFWIKNYEWASSWICIVVGALVFGLVIGIGWRDNFWKRTI